MRGPGPRAPVALTLGPQPTIHFPLCAVPGREHRHGDLATVLAGTSILNNFDDQRRFRPMYPEAGRPVPHPYQWFCDACLLAGLCHFRALFRVRSTQEDGVAPVPHRGPADDVARRLGMVGASGFSVPEPRPTTPTVLRSLLRDLLERRAGPWDPLETGIVAIGSGPNRVRVRCGEPELEGGWFLPLRDDLAVSATGEGFFPEPDPGSVLDAFLRWLAAADLASEPCEAPWYRACRVLTARWSRTLNVAPTRFSFRLRATGSPCPGLDVRVAPPPGPEGWTARLRSLRDDGRDGFLCGRVRLEFAPGLLEAPEGRLVARVIAEGVAAAQDLLPEGWPRPMPWQAEAWRRFGARLLPMATDDLVLASGAVDPRGLVLVFHVRGGEAVVARLDPDTLTWRRA